MRSNTAIPAITETLCELFATTADALARHRVGEIPERAIDDFVALGWLRWHGGSLRVTPLGEMALLRIRTRLSEAVAA